MTVLYILCIVIGGLAVLLGAAKKDWNFMMLAIGYLILSFLLYHKHEKLMSCEQVIFSDWMETYDG